jgi:N-acetylmuramic acid 6-phosphate etherase
MTVDARMDDPVTERRIEAHSDLDLRGTRELVELINDADATVAAAVAAAAGPLAEAVDAIVERLQRGGRLVYAGAGTSGRLAAVDAAECPSTFGIEPDRVLAVVAVEEAHEDDIEAGAEGALTVGVACVPDAPLAAAVEFPVTVVVGPEVIAGSTRMKAGTAQKLVLNTISTIAMVRLGRTFGNLMVAVAALNEKQRGRARRTVELATGAGEAEVDAALDAAGGDAKVAIVSLLAGVDAVEARGRLDRNGGVVRRSLERP